MFEHLIVYSKNPRDILVSIFRKQFFVIIKKCICLLFYFLIILAMKLLCNFGYKNFGNEIIVEIKGIYQPQKYVSKSYCNTKMFKTKQTINRKITVVELSAIIDLIRNQFKLLTISSGSI